MAFSINAAIISISLPLVAFKSCHRHPPALERSRRRSELVPRPKHFSEFSTMLIPWLSLLHGRENHHRQPSFAAVGVPTSLSLSHLRVECHVTAAAPLTGVCVSSTTSLNSSSSNRDTWVKHKQVNPVERLGRTPLRLQCMVDLLEQYITINHKHANTMV